MVGERNLVEDHARTQRRDEGEAPCREGEEEEGGIRGPSKYDKGAHALTGDNKLSGGTSNVKQLLYILANLASMVTCPSSLLVLRTHHFNSLYA
jgi:hypothetical protein